MLIGLINGLKNDAEIYLVKGRQGSQIGQVISFGNFKTSKVQPFITQNDVYGYEFQLNGKVIGTVSTINNGKVWLKKDLPDDLKLVLASVSSGLMLRNNVEENALSLK